MLPHTVSTRIALLAGILATAGAAALSLILIRAQRAQVLAEVVHGSESVAETICLSINQDMLGNRSEGVREVVESVGKHPGIAGVRLFNKEGRISYSSRPDEVGRIVDKKAEACVKCHFGPTPFQQLDLKDRSRIYTDRDGQEILSTIHVIRNEPGCYPAGCHKPPAEQSVLGVLDVAMSLEPTRTRLSAATRNAILTSFGAVSVIAGVLFLVIRRSVRQPVDRLIAATQRVSAGDYQLQVPPGSADEMGFLARSFNDMIENLNSSQQQLEEKVAKKAAELRAARFQVVQAEKLSSVGLVAAGIAHELNSPLMAIVTFTHMLQKNFPADSLQYKDSQMILREADRCAAIIRNLLDFSRDQSQGLQNEPCEISKLIEHCLELLKVEIRHHGIEVDRSIEPDLPIVEANTVQLTQVFVNLILNAIQALPAGGRVTIAADVVEKSQYAGVTMPPDPSQRLVRIRVRDNGIGIPAGDLPKIFDPFFTTKPVGQGSGLGLSVSHGIVTHYRGTIFAESNGKTGTEFTVLLPAATQPEHSRAT